MTVKCITCDRLQLRKVPAMAKQGLGGCELRAGAGVFVSITFQRECAKHSQASDKTVTARRAWASKVKP